MKLSITGLLASGLLLCSASAFAQDTYSGIVCWYNDDGQYYGSDGISWDLPAGSVFRTGQQGEYAAGYLIGTTQRACPYNLPSDATRGVTAALIKKDFSSCTNDDVVEGKKASVGGYVTAFPRSDKSVRVEVRLNEKVTADTAYEFSHKCERTLGTITTAEESAWGASFDLPAGSYSSTLAFDMYPSGAPSGNKYQSVKISL